MSVCVCTNEQTQTNEQRTLYERKSIPLRTDWSLYMSATTFIARLRARFTRVEPVVYETYDLVETCPCGDPDCLIGILEDGECDRLTRQREDHESDALDPWPHLTDEQHAAKREQVAFERWMS